MTPEALAAFYEELTKIGAARLHGKGILSVRKGKRPISVVKLLDREKKGKLHKFQHAKEAASGGDSAGKPDDVAGGWDDAGAAKQPNRPWESPDEAKSTTMSTKEGACYDELCKIAGFFGDLRNAGTAVLEHAGAAAKEHAQKAVGHVADAVTPAVEAAKQHVKEVAAPTIEKARAAHLEHTREAGKQFGSAVVAQGEKDLRASAKKTWDDHKGKIIAGTAAAYAGNKGLNYAIGRHRDKKLSDDIAHKVKTGQVPGAPGSVNPMTSGDGLTAAPETLRRPSPGDAPTQSPGATLVRSDGVAQTMSPSVDSTTAVPFTTGKQQALRKGESPGQPKDPSAVDRMDGRDAAATVTGVAGGLSGISPTSTPGGEHS